MNKENLINHKVEDGLLIREKGVNAIFFIEYDFSIEEKLEIIDAHSEGKGTYLYDIMKKWEDEKDTLRKDEWGNVKTVSKKAWIKRNDTLNRKKGVESSGTIDAWCRYGNYYFFNVRHMDIGTTNRAYRSSIYRDDDVVHQWFHDLLIILRGKEVDYANSIDPRKVKTMKLKDYYDRTKTDFDNREIGRVVWNPHNWKDYKVENLDKYLKVYEEFMPHFEEYRKIARNIADKHGFVRDIEEDY